MKKNGFTFYVLSTNNVDHELITEESTDKTVKSINLILDRYINSEGSIATELVTKETNPNKYNMMAWNDEIENAAHFHGPLTVMKFLHNATKNWTKVEPINFSYVQSSYAGVTSNPGIIDWRGLFNFESINGVAKINGERITDSSPLRVRIPIYHATYDSSLIKTSEKGEVADLKIDGSNQFLYVNNIDGFNGYWLLSGYPSYLSHASVVLLSSTKKVVDGMPLTTSSSVGARPVITVNIDDIK